MKKLVKSMRTISAIIAAGLASASCFDLPSSASEGTLQISIREKSIPDTRGGVPEVGDFILEVTDAKGGSIYNGPYADSPDVLEVKAGSYTVSVLSSLDSSPAFDRPQYGDTQVIVVPAGQCVAVQMICTQINSGLKLNIKDSFKETFPEGQLKLKSAKGELDYGYEETRIAYFEPGSVSMLLENDGKTEALFSRMLEPRQILSLNVGAVGGETGAGVSIQVDTTRLWTSEDFCYGSGGDDLDDALDVTEARARSGQEGVWVYGYIVGSFNTSSGPSFSAPFNKNTNIAIGTRSGTTDKNCCLSVELKSGPIRDAVNLKENPSNLGRGIYLKGDLVDAYYGIPGLKNVTEFQWK